MLGMRLAHLYFEERGGNKRLTSKKRGKREGGKSLDYPLEKSGPRRRSKLVRRLAKVRWSKKTGPLQRGVSERKLK